MKNKLKIENDNLMPRTIMFPGSFDPFHHGHEVLVQKALALFDEVIIVVSRNPEKEYHHSSAERALSIQNRYQNNSRVRVLINDNYLTAVFAQKHQCNYLLRGFRNEQDFAYEAQMARYNKAINPQLELVYFFTEKIDEKTSSTFLNEIDQYKEKHHYE